MTVKLTKQTHQDLMSQFEAMSLKGYVINYDPVKMYIFTKDWGDSEEGEGTKYYRYTYSMNGPTVEVDPETMIQIQTKFDYEVVKDQTEVKLDKVLKLLEKFGPTKKEVRLIKQFDDKSKKVNEALWIAYGEVDGQGDGYKNKEAVYDLVKSFNLHKDSIQKALNHTCKVNFFEIGEAWVNEEESMLGDTLVPKLQPMVELKYTDKAFELRKQGKLLGPSIGCTAWSVELTKSLLDELKVDVKPKRLVGAFDFSQKSHHLSLTTPSVGGPASMKNYLIEMEKSMLDPEAMALLEELEEEFTPLEKKLISYGVDSEIAPSTSAVAEAQDAGVDKNQPKGNKSEMSEKTERELELEKQLADALNKNKAAELAKSLSKYQLESELESELASALVSVSDEALTSITKALDSVVEAKAEIEKQLESAPTEENELAKQLQQAKAIVGDDSDRKAKGTLGQRAGAKFNEMKSN